MRSRGSSARRLEMEATTLARMRPHPNVVAVFDIGREEGRPFVVSEYLRIVRDLKSFARIDRADEERIHVRALIESSLAVLAHGLGRRS